MTKIQTSPKWKIIKINAWLLVQKSSDLSKLFFDVTYKPQKTLLSPKFGPKGYLTSAEKTKKPRMTQMLVYNLGNVSKRSETVFFGKFGAFRTIWHLGVTSSNLKQKELCSKTKSFESDSPKRKSTVASFFFLTPFIKNLIAYRSLISVICFWWNPRWISSSIFFFVFNNIEGNSIIERIIHLYSTKTNSLYHSK